MAFSILVIDTNRISMRFHKEKKGGPVREVDSMEIKLDFFMGGEADQASFNAATFFLLSLFLAEAHREDNPWQ
jgi:hypothetical protein